MATIVGTADEIETYMHEQKKINPTKKYKVDDFYEKRSSKANRYMWELLDKLCNKMNLESIEEYRRRVRELGIFRQWDVEKENFNTFKKMWEDKGLAWFCEVIDTKFENNKEKLIVNTYYGSSSFNSKQMSRLIDGIVQDCQAIGIETKSEEEIKSLIGSR